jgi:hypothetical protein
MAGIMPEKRHRLIGVLNLTKHDVRRRRIPEGSPPGIRARE